MATRIVATQADRTRWYEVLDAFRLDQLAKLGGGKYVAPTREERLLPEPADNIRCVTEFAAIGPGVVAIGLGLVKDGACFYNMLAVIEPSRWAVSMRDWRNAIREEQQGAIARESLRRFPRIVVARGLVKVADAELDTQLRSDADVKRTRTLMAGDVVLYEDDLRRVAATR